MPFTDLRNYRRTAMEEETRVSYWRMLIIDRIDSLKGESPVVYDPKTGRPKVKRPPKDLAAAPERLAAALGSTATGSTRVQLLVVPATHEPLPQMPEVADLWLLHAPADDHARRAEIVALLEHHLAALSAWRTALHIRIDEATDELICRYQAEPDLALTLIPDPADLSRHLDRSSKSHQNNAGR